MPHSLRAIIDRWTNLQRVVGPAGVLAPQPDFVKKKTHQKQQRNITNAGSMSGCSPTYEHSFHVHLKCCQMYGFVADAMGHRATMVPMWRRMNRSYASNEHVMNRKFITLCIVPAAASVIARSTVRRFPCLHPGKSTVYALPSTRQEFST